MKTKALPVFNLGQLATRIKKLIPAAKTSIEQPGGDWEGCSSHLSWANLSICGGLLVLMVLSTIVYVISEVGDRHKVITKDGKEIWYIAKHVYLPGYIHIHEPEQHFPMDKWVGTNNVVQAEATSAIGFLMSGAFPDYTVKSKGNGHYELFKPAKDSSYFSMEKPYRLGPWFLAKDMR